jgi:hypothetical protein
MFDDPGDIDRNGIPDSIQRDPVGVPEDPQPLSGFAPDPGLPGIDPPIEATADDASAQPMPEPPVEPPLPPADADEATLMEYQRQLQKYSQTMETISNLLQMQHEANKAVAQNLRG